jgi:hypothetical protein
MFNPSKDDVRRFFCATWAKRSQGLPLTPLESLAADWITEHPEFHADLSNEEKALAKDYSVEAGATNPFLHLSMHLSIEEQISIDQPPGITAAFARLAQRLDSRHQAMHVVMECLGQALWQAQKNQAPIDADAYLESIRRAV